MLRAPETGLLAATGKAVGTEGASRRVRSFHFRGPTPAQPRHTSAFIQGRTAAEVRTLCPYCADKWAQFLALIL